ncbi:hydroxyisourate hydrolase [Pseudooctadecabacter sp.]|uniref:hydroxyisourate hydrolase n=1 Tax=Pseudooctadecabacter sp. TaxID=1966338 RepID=UPI0025E8705F|nr:hydroxyisourate hydrolase [Pseudooctadecabacter sp.]
MSGYLTTHILDTARGLPAEGINIALFKIENGERQKIAETVTNSDGRTNAPILPAEAFEVGQYELVFFCGEYLENHGLTGGNLKFLDDIPIRFGMDDPAAHYHVPLLLSPYGYSTYRGS